MMTAELRPAVLTDSADLVVTNRGQSVARDVQVTFDPPLPVLTGDDAKNLTTPYLQRRYAEPISTFTPGMIMQSVYQSGINGQRVASQVRPRFHESHGMWFKPSIAHHSYP